MKYTVRNQWKTDNGWKTIILVPCIGIWKDPYSKVTIFFTWLIWNLFITKG